MLFDVTEQTVGLIFFGLNFDVVYETVQLFGDRSWNSMV